MRAEIQPEPSEAEREAILDALRALEDEADPYASGWRSAESPVDAKAWLRRG